jgi:hypothetical protein
MGWTSPSLKQEKEHTYRPSLPRHTTHQSLNLGCQVRVRIPSFPAGRFATGRICRAWQFLRRGSREPGAYFYVRVCTYACGDETDGGIGGLRLGWVGLRLYLPMCSAYISTTRPLQIGRLSAPPLTSSILHHLDTTPHDFKISAATRIAALVLPTHSCASSASWSNVIDSVMPGNVTGAYPVSLPGANSVFW